MNFKQLDHEHVAQAWERMKLMIRNCPTHGFNLWVIIQKNYAKLNFASRNLLDSAAGGTFMEITLGEATKLLYNIMVNYSHIGFGSTIVTDSRSAAEVDESV